MSRDDFWRRCFWSWRRRRCWQTIIFLFSMAAAVYPAPSAARLLVFMDQSQTRHCQAYGLTYGCLKRSLPGVFWLLNYRGGSFLLPDTEWVRQTAKKRGVSFTSLSAVAEEAILNEIDEENMDVIPLEKAPDIAIYLPEGDHVDVVADTLSQVGIPFKKIYDQEILQGGLRSVDWLHVHHKDFTGQGHKCGHFGGDGALAGRLGYAKVWAMKQKVADEIHSYVARGGFLFAMCSAAETLDISLAAYGIDIAPSSIDGDAAAPDANQRLDFQRSLAFTGFTVFTGQSRAYSDIDVPNTHPGPFSLFEFSATVDAVPTLLNQNHVQILPGFFGETTSFRKSLVKRNVTILAENHDGVSVRYLCGFLGDGVFCYYGGHAPGDGSERLLQAAPGFRLILNNVLFPAAKVKKRKT